MSDAVIIKNGLQYVVELQGGSPAKYYASAQLAAQLAEDAAAAATTAEALVASNAAIAAAAAALITGAAINFTAGTALGVRPEDNGGTGPTGQAGALAAAAAVGGYVQLSPNTTYVWDREQVVPVGVKITGPRTAVLKLRDQISTTLTSGFTSGTGAKTFTVTDASAFVVGQSVMIASTTTHVFSPNDPFSHAGRQISAISGNTVTLAAGPSVSAQAAGDIMASTCHLLRCQGDNVLEGFAIDGNAANNTYAHWQNSAMIAQEGNRVTLRGLYIHDTPSDAYLVGGPSGGEIVDSKVIGCTFLNIGGNGIHYGNARDFIVVGNRMITGNVRYLLPIEQGGGAPDGRQGHQDGAVIYSFACYGTLVVANHIRDWICGVSIGTTSAGGINDKMTAVANEFIDCALPLEVLNAGQQVVFSSNRVTATFPFGTGSNRWTACQLKISNNSDTRRPQNVIISDNFFKNASIFGTTPYGLQIEGNTFDNRDMNGSTFNNVDQNGAMSLYGFESLSVRGNMVLGGYLGMWLQNSNGATFGLNVLISDNHFLNQYQTAISGSATFPIPARIAENIIRANSAATKDDGTTVIPIAANWTGINLLSGFEVQRNKIDFNVGTGAFTSTNAVAAANRLDNTVNGLLELLGNFANDAAAATGNVAVGGKYRNGSVIQQRVS